MEINKYKHCSPEQTIHNIRTKLFDIGILLKELHFSNNNGVSYSCRVYIGNLGLENLNIGSNGKGRSFEYALASAYAEFMERLQNRMLLNKRHFAQNEFLDKISFKNPSYVSSLYGKKINLDFLFDKKEVLWNVDFAVSQIGTELMRLLHLTNENEVLLFLKNEMNIESLLMIPFYSISKNKTTLLPINLLHSIVGSTGMCAGNTAREAILQGICEIFERFVTREIYNRELTPPTIPLLTFAEYPIHEKISQLSKETNFQLIIKDCSLNRNFPVLGLLIIDQKNRCYNFKLGADFDPSIALERCLNELYQHPTDIIWLPLNTENFNSIKCDKKLHFNNFKKIVFNGSGLWPLSIFSQTNSYTFHGFPSSHDSRNSCIQKAFEIIQKEGYNIYIRDNSILGFPSYYVIIPGMSELTTSNNNIQYKNNFTNIGLLKSLDDISLEKVNLILDALIDNYEIMKVDNYNYTNLYLYNTNIDLLNLDLDILIFMLSYYSENMKQARAYLNKFLKNKNKNLFAYYYAISDFLNLKYEEKIKNKEIRFILTNIYGNNITNEILTDFNNPKDIFQYYDFPRCFDCDNCKVKDSCRWLEVLHIENIIKSKQLENVVDQQYLEKELYDKM